MEDIDIIKVIRGEASDDECSRVLRWINESEDNLNYFSGLKALWTFSAMPADNKNEAAEKPKRIYIRYFSVAAAAIIVLLVLNLFVNGGSFSSWQSKSHKAVILSEKTNIRTMYVEKGVKGKVTLPDGSVVTLNSDSKIVYPDNFIGSTREVELSGEAYFDVVKDSLKPMVVNTAKGVKIKVLGTKFLLKSYANDNETKAILYSGIINLTTKSGKNGEDKTIQMSPNDCAVIPDNGEPMLTKDGKESNDSAWMRGELIFNKTPMTEVLKILERSYGKSFIVNEKSLYNYNLSASFKYESLIQILEMVEFCTNVQYKIDGERVIFY